MDARVPADIRVDRYVIETLMPDLVGHDRHPSAFLVYLFLVALKSADRSSVALSLGQIAEGTGLSKRAVQAAVSHLRSRRLLSAERENITSVASYTIHRPWMGRRDSPMTS
jgi:hypothetical protein